MPSLSGNNVNVTVTTKADTRGVTETEEALGGLSTKSAAIFGAMAGFAQAVAIKGIAMITSSVGDAINRVDTLDNASRAFQNMGFKVDDTKHMMDNLKSSILGLPTPLNDAVSGVEILAASTNDLKKSQEIFTALNDGILGFGGSAADVKGAIVQISQAFSNGKIDAQTWNSLMQNNMGPALSAIAKQLGITTGALKDGLSDGTVSVGQFQDALIKLDKEGGGGMASLQKIAHDSTSGISTGMANAKTAVTRGLGNILEAIGTANISGAISASGKGFEKFANDVAKDIPAAKKYLGQLSDYMKAELSPVIGNVVKHFKELPPVVQVLTDPMLTFYTHIHNLSGFMKELRDEVVKLWAAFKENTIIIILTQYFQQVMLPALKAIWAAIVQNLWPALKQLIDALKRLWDALQPGLMEALKIIGAILGGLLLLAIWVVLAAINLLVQAFAIAVSAISIAIDWISNLIKWFGNLIGVVVNTVGSIISIFKNLWPAFKDVVSLIGQAVGAVGGLLFAPFKWAYDAIIGLFKNLPKELGNLVSGAMGNVSSAAKSTLHNLHIPGFAAGVHNFSGGLAVVGERGPELVNLPAGSSVYTNSQSQQMMGGGTSITIQSLVLPGVTDRQSFIASLDQDTLLAGRGLTPNRGLR